MENVAPEEIAVTSASNAATAAYPATSGPAAANASTLALISRESPDGRTGSTTPCGCGGSTDTGPL
ncbi:hypothetical protein GTS_08850 [Gandjariella thermophila]|uniref:Uncharacterized protein n=1 Tax=Gandjariella thermophila TaxID=1931992 RepID=A0A4D4J2B8_9PSEU|nr:hypothetical protein GTS_08850 [Gandjariella thermophila]